VRLAIALGGEFLINFFAAVWAKSHGRIGAAVIHIPAAVFIAHVKFPSGS